MNDILIQPLTQDAFAPYGDVLTLKSTPDKLINQGLCGRHHDLAAMDFGPDGRAGVSGPYGMTNVLSHYMYEVAISEYGERYGYGSAVATVLFAIMMVFISYFLWRMYQDERRGG